MVFRDRRSSRMSCSQRPSKRKGLRCGREERSWRPAAPSRRCRVLHFLAVFLLIPAAPAAAATLQSSCSIRATSNARLDGQVRALLWRFIRWAPCGCGRLATPAIHRTQPDGQPRPAGYNLLSLHTLAPSEQRKHCQCPQGDEKHRPPAGQTAPEETKECR